MQKERGGRYWTITLPGSFEAKGGMVRLREGSVLFPQGFDFKPYRHIRLTLPAPAPQDEGAELSDTPEAPVVESGTPSGPEISLDAPPGTQGRFFPVEKPAGGSDAPGKSWPTAGQSRRAHSKYAPVMAPANPGVEPARDVPIPNP